ncbi:TMV resistance protein N-like [Neltuma alba]|uniref:TMV resistance protein N-like n=1 Tax=Neltuma alba TaxID=207710 RepID=UPI0010A4F6CC|nr:TMV resistance protein N-like [Prosopis alba]
MPQQSPFSSSFSYGWTYDVFLNFRGEDTRFGFARNLYEALQQKAIHTFLDNERLRKGEKITPSLLKAIQKSRMAITIFSKNYASSTFCLDELVHILEHINKKGRLVLPIFYDVDPSEVRHQRKNNGEVFAQHGRRFKNDKEKVQKWSSALQDAATLSGFHFKPGYQYEYALIKAIVKEVTRRINRKPLHVADYPVGLEYRVQKVNSLLDVESSEGVQMVGICGTGGIGKSTIARAVCGLIVDSFEGFCFLADVRENSINHGLVYLQEILLSEMLEEDVKLRDVNQGIPIIKHRLHKKKVLLVLDDVDELKQLQAIAGGPDWFGSGSRIIVTTRDKHLLVSHGVKRIYEVDFLNREEGLELLKWHAFKQSRVDASYMDILNHAVFYACGLPLALEVIGSDLFSREINYWNSALEHSIPIKEIQQILKVSYDALEEYEQENFLGIACCFKGDSFEYVRSALFARRICPDYGVKVLIDKCLIKINHGKVTMHDLIQAMGKEILRQKSSYEPGKRTRLWLHKDILHVLEENKGSGKIEAINLDMPGDIVIDWSGNAFKRMPNLKILIIRNAQFSTGPTHLPNSLRVLDWKGYPCPSLPSDFNPKELIILKMPETFLQPDVLLNACRLIKTQLFLILSRRIPDLRELCLECCNKLIEVHVSIGFLGKLKRLSVKHCRKLKTFPSIKLTSLEFLDLSWCSSLTRFPEVRVNGTDVGFPEGQTILSSLTTPHVFLFDLRRFVLEDKLRSVVSERGWNHVEISCVLSYINCSDPMVLGKIYCISKAKWSGAYVYKQKSKMEDIRFINLCQEAVSELSKGSSMNPDSFTESVLPRMKWSDMDFKVSGDSNNNADMSLLSKPIAESHSVTGIENNIRKRDGRDLSIWVPPPLTRSLLCPSWMRNEESEGKCYAVTKK